ncbi:MAG: hypothetical protein HY701_14990 [Gemmatimonadetes bacterium]|nr:hypothetical protein [Gemmatimonadota bacterium]
MATSAGAMAGAPARSRKVRKILRFEARAHRLLARYERALARATHAMAQARALLDNASLLESSLTGTQLGELRRGRPDAAGVGTAPVATPLDRTFTTTRT